MQSCTALNAAAPLWARQHSSAACTVGDYALSRRPLYCLSHMQYEIDTDSIGNVVCKKAEELDAAVTVLARHR